MPQKRKDFLKGGGLWTSVCPACLRAWQVFCRLGASVWVREVGLGVWIDPNTLPRFWLIELFLFCFL